MFRLFPSIRQKLLNDGKSVKYVKYAVGEFLLIVAGILAALQIQSWNEGINERNEERKALVRLEKELEINFKSQSDHLERIEDKALSLRKIQRDLTKRLVKDQHAFLEAIASTTRFSWGHPDFPRTTFEELNVSGKMGLIRNVDLRIQLFELYRRFEAIERSVASRKSDYALLAYRLIPRENEYYLRKDMHRDEMLARVATIMDSNLNQSITAEINRSQYEIMTYEDVLNSVQNLRDSINAELND